MSEFGMTESFGSKQERNGEPQRVLPSQNKVSTAARRFFPSNYPLQFVIPNAVRNLIQLYTNYLIPYCPSPESFSEDSHTQNKKIPLYDWFAQRQNKKPPLNPKGAKNS